ANPSGHRSPSRHAAAPPRDPGSARCTRPRYWSRDRAGGPAPPPFFPCRRTGRRRHRPDRDSRAPPRPRRARASLSEDLRHAREVDVPSRNDRDDALTGPHRDLPRDEGPGRGRTRGLRDKLRALREETHSLGDEVIVDHDDIRDETPHDVERNRSGDGCRETIGDRVDALEPYRLARVER